MKQPVILEVAVNGGTTKARNPHTPIHVDEIVADFLACLDAGASIVHQHDDLKAMPGSSVPEAMATLSAAVYRAVYRERPDAICYPTSGFNAPVETRWAHHHALDEEGLLMTAFADPGSVNIWNFDAQGRIAPSTFVYANSHADIVYILGQCAARGLGPNMAIFEPGFLRATLEHEKAGTLAPGAFVKLYFGGPRAAFGLPPTAQSVDAYLAMFDAFGSRLPWGVAVLGGDVIDTGVADHALARGGHLRVGLEDYSGPDTPTNLELVRRAVAACERADRPVATPAQAAELLGLRARMPAPV